MRSRRDKKRARERDRNKRNRKYGQIKRKHSRKGIWSCVMAVLVTAVIAGLIVMAFLNKGKSAAMVGFQYDSCLHRYCNWCKRI